MDNVLILYYIYQKKIELVFIGKLFVFILFYINNIDIYYNGQIVSRGIYLFKGDQKMNDFDIDNIQRF